VSEQELIAKRLKGAIAKMDRTYKYLLKRSWKNPNNPAFQAEVKECREYWGW